MCKTLEIFQRRIEEAKHLLLLEVAIEDSKAG